MGLHTDILARAGHCDFIFVSSFLFPLAQFMIGLFLQQALPVFAEELEVVQGYYTSS